MLAVGIENELDQVSVRVQGPRHKRKASLRAGLPFGRDIEPRNPFSRVTKLGASEVSRGYT
jgi:hypothetical protein